MHDIDIVSIRRVDNAKPRQDGCKVLAKIDFRANGFQFERASLVRSPAPRSALSVWLPNVDRDSGMIGYADPTLRSAVLQTVLTAYKAIGGRDAEWEPPVVENGAGTADDVAGVRRFVAG
jgi:hypothetical protein